MFWCWHLLKFQPVNTASSSMRFVWHHRRHQCDADPVWESFTSSKFFSISMQSFIWCFHFVATPLFVSNYTKHFSVRRKILSSTFFLALVWCVPKNKTNLPNKSCNLFIKLSKRKFCSNLFISKLIAKPFFCVCVLPMSLFRFQFIEQWAASSSSNSWNKKCSICWPEIEQWSV